MTSSYMENAATAENNWLVVDASEQVLGRLASKVAHILRGKHKPTYTPHSDGGDFVIIVNAEKVKVTGNKLDQKTYYRHTGFPGGIKSVVLSDLMQKKPTKALEIAIKGMLPRTKLGRQMFTKLKIYQGQEHPHKAQSPQVLEL